MVSAFHRQTSTDLTMMLLTRFLCGKFKQTFDRLLVDARRLAVTGFCDGASCALWVGLPNGDLFTHVIASPAAHRGKPSVYVSHGTRAQELPIDRCSRRTVPQLECAGHR